MNDRITQLSELNSVHSVKILLCYLLERLDRTVTEQQLRLIAEDSEVINYFYFSDALGELIENNSITAESFTDINGITDRKLDITSKGRLGSDYFNLTIPLVYRKKLLKAAFQFFARLERRSTYKCVITENSGGCGFDVSFTLAGDGFDLMRLTFYAPDKEQAELISEKIGENPSGAYTSILGFLLDNKEENVDVERYL